MANIAGRARKLAARFTVLAALVVATTALAVSPPPAGAQTEGGLEGFAAVAALDELTDDHARLFRLYWAVFGREPDADGAIYWIAQVDGCLTLDEAAHWFMAGREFERAYGDPDNDAFVTAIYYNVLGRHPDESGRAYWVDKLATGELDRPGVVLNVSLSDEFTTRHPYPSDGVPARSCLLPTGALTTRSVHTFADPAASTLAIVEDGLPGGEGLSLAMPSPVIERAGFHQSTHPGALAMTTPDAAEVRTSTMASRGRGTALTGAIDVTTEPDTVITAPVSGTVARAGSYTLYCRYRDGYVVINPDERPDLEVKLLHVQEVAVQAGQRVEVGDVIAGHATKFPFTSQIDALTAEPSWPHVHIEVVDPSIPRNRSGGTC